MNDYLIIFLGGVCCGIAGFCLSKIISLKDYISKHPELVEISYEPVKKSADDQGREKLYQVYVQKNLPDWKY